MLDQILDQMLDLVLDRELDLELDLVPDLVLMDLVLCEARMYGPSTSHARQEMQEGRMMSV